MRVVNANDNRTCEFAGQVVSPPNDGLQRAGLGFKALVGRRRQPFELRLDQMLNIDSETLDRMDIEHPGIKPRFRTLKTE